jgi:hypothetical protein
MPDKDPKKKSSATESKPPKRQSYQEWYAEMLKNEFVPTQDVNSPEVKNAIKMGKRVEFYNPKLTDRDEKGWMINKDGTDATIFSFEAPKPMVKAREVKPFANLTGKGIVTGPYQTINNNTGKMYDPTTGQEITPKVYRGGVEVDEPMSKAKGGLVKKYDLGGTIVKNKDAVGSVAGGLGQVAMMGGAAMDANNEADEMGQINENKAAGASALKWGGTAAGIAGNPALIAATGGLSLLAIPAAAGIGAVVGARKAGQANDEAMALYEKEKKDEKIAASNRRVADAIRQRDMGLAKGGKVVGAGTGTSDSIKAKVEEGSFIVPAKNAPIAKEISEKVLMKAPQRKAQLKQDGGEVVKLSNGEYMFTPEEVAELEAKGINLDALAPEARKDLDEYMKCGGEVKGYAKGGTVGDDPYMTAFIELSKKANSNKATQEDLDLLNSVGKELVKASRGQVSDVAKKYISAKQIDSKSSKPVPKKAAAKPVVTEEVITPQPNGLTPEQMRQISPNLNEITPSGTSVTPLVSEAQKNLGTPIQTTGGIENMSPFNASAANTTNSPASGSKFGATDIQSMIGYGVPLIQSAIGWNQLQKQGKRPVDKLDPEYLERIENAKGLAATAQKEALFGMTPEEKFLLDQQNQGLLNQQRSTARNQFASGSGGTALNLERAAINDSYGRGLMTKVQDNNLKLQKQAIAADRAANVDALVAGKTNMARRLFNDEMTAWQQKQMAAGDLTAQGLTNVISQNRYNQFLKNRQLEQ